MKNAADQAVPITNYGIAIAYMKGILRRSLSVFPDLQRCCRKTRLLARKATRKKQPATEPAVR